MEDNNNEVVSYRGRASLEEVWPDEPERAVKFWRKVDCYEPPFFAPTDSPIRRSRKRTPSRRLKSVKRNSQRVWSYTPHTIYEYDAVRLLVSWGQRWMRGNSLPFNYRDPYVNGK